MTHDALVVINQMGEFYQDQADVSSERQCRMKSVTLLISVTGRALRRQSIVLVLWNGPQAQD